MWSPVCNIRPRSMHNSAITPQSIKKSVVMFFREKFVVLSTRRRCRPAVPRKPAQSTLSRRRRRNLIRPRHSNAGLGLRSRQAATWRTLQRRSSITADAASEQFRWSTNVDAEIQSEERERISTHVDGSGDGAPHQPTKTELAVERTAEPRKLYEMKVNAESTYAPAACI